MILPPATLGMLGGGQLGRYFVMAAHRLGYKVVVLDPDPASIAGAAADHHIVAPYDDQTALLELASRCEAISCEFENVPAATLALLEQQKPVRPGASAVRICQDRREEKAFLRGADIPIAPYLALLPEEPIPAQASELLPAILKTAREGYDGKGQWQVNNLDELATALAASGVPCVLEQRLALEGEFALTLARSPSGAISALPLVQNWHSGGILDQTRSPANVPTLESEAKGIAERHDRSPRLRRGADGGVLSGGGEAIGQRAGAPPPQLGSPQPRQRCMQPVRVAGAGPVRSAAARADRRAPRPVNQPAGGSLAKRHPRLGCPAGAARPASAPLWQGRTPPRPQDGPYHGNR